MIKPRTLWVQNLNLPKQFLLNTSSTIDTNVQTSFIYPHNGPEETEMFPGDGFWGVRVSEIAELSSVPILAAWAQFRNWALLTNTRRGSKERTAPLICQKYLKLPVNMWSGRRTPPTHPLPQILDPPLNIHFCSDHRIHLGSVSFEEKRMPPPPNPRLRACHWALCSSGWY
jgi:hypothetical protein